MQLCLYGNNGSLQQQRYQEYLSRRRTDTGAPLITRACIATTYDSTVPELRAQHPHLEIVALTGPGCVLCVTRGGGRTLAYDRPHQGIDQPGRSNSNPDMSVAQAVADHLREGFADHHCRNQDGTIAVPQTHDAVWHPLGKTLHYRRHMRSVLGVWAMEAERLCNEGPEYHSMMQDVHFGTWLSYGGIWREMGVPLEAWRSLWDSVVRGVRLAGVKIGENCYGPGGPRNSGCADYYKIENMYRQGGFNSHYGWWGYLACVTAYDEYRSGLPLMTPEQAAQSMMTVHPADEWGTPTEQYEHLKACLLTAQLYDIGYVGIHETRHGEVWDAHAMWRYDAELWTRLVPDGETVWRHYGTWEWTATAELPDAHVCYQDGDWLGRRRMRDPIGGQKYLIELNPNDQVVGNMPARSADLERRG